jgi:hypothetical protein
MLAARGRRDPGDMNQTVGISQPAPSPAGQDGIRSRRDAGALLATPLIGTAVTAVSGFTALLAAGVVSFLYTGNTDPNLPANAYANAHFHDAYLTSNPLPLAACCALIAAAAALAATRRRVPAALLLCAAAAMPWIPAIDFLHHVWQLAPASTRG